MHRYTKTFLVVFVAVLLTAPQVFADEAEGPSELAISEAKTAPDVDDREPVDATDTFNAGDQVNAWMAVQAPEDTTLEVVWKANGDEVHSFDLDVSTSHRWRTWAAMNVSQAGDWEVDIRDSNGDSLETLSFSVEE